MIKSERKHTKGFIRNVGAKKLYISGSLDISVGLNIFICDLGCKT